MVERKDDINRVLRWIIFPLFLIVVILMVLIPEWVLGGLVALALLFITFAIYTSDKFQSGLIGIPDHIFQGSGWAFGLFAFFFGLSKFNSSLSIAVPTVPQAVTTFSFDTFALGTPISILILVGIFPFAETVWKASMIPALMKLYSLSLNKAIIVTALLFGAILHWLAYGIVISSAESFGAALEQISSISGLLFTASLFGGLASWVMFKTKNVFPVALAHAGINYTIVTTTLAIITLL